MTRRGGSKLLCLCAICAALRTGAVEGTALASIGVSQTTTCDKSAPLFVDSGVFPGFGFTISTFRVTGGGVVCANRVHAHKQTRAILPRTDIRRILSNGLIRICL